MCSGYTAVLSPNYKFLFAAKYATTNRTKEEKKKEKR
jgi:hypothetical protein